MAKTGEVAPKKEAKKLTTDEAIAGVRGLRAGNLFVSDMRFIDLLLGAYDKAAADLELANLAVQDLQSAKEEAASYKEKFEAANVSINDLMATVKQRERELAAFGVVVDPNK